MPSRIFVSKPIAALRHEHAQLIKLVRRMDVAIESASALGDTLTCCNEGDLAIAYRKFKRWVELLEDAVERAEIGKPPPVSGVTDSPPKAPRTKHLHK